LLRAGAEKLTDRQWTRFETAIAAHEAHLQVWRLFPDEGVADDAAAVGASVPG